MRVNKIPLKDGFFIGITFPSCAQIHHMESQKQSRQITNDIFCKEESLPAGGTFLDGLDNYLKRLYPAMEDSGFKLTNDNTYNQRFLLQTPDAWGKDSSEVPVNAGISIAQRVQSLIASAQEFIDITTLAPFPDGAFFHAIQDGLISLANNGKNITVRMLAGWPPSSFGDATQKQYLEQLVKPLASAKNLSIYVAAQCDPYIDLTWNHAKIVAIDGKQAMVGGENLWAANYLGPYPVHDLNLWLDGSAVYYLHKFIDPIWNSVCKYTEDSWKSAFWSAETGIIQQCLPSSNIPAPNGNGAIKILGAGRYGTYDSAFKPADGAMLYCLRMARQTIYIAQQDLLNQLIPWPAGMEALAEAIIRGVNVRIVISNDDGKASATFDPASSKSDSYSTSTQSHTYVELKSFIEAQALVHGQSILGGFELAVLRFGPSDSWPKPNEWQFANHAKFFMIDEQVACIGSENIYPANLIEYVLFMEDPGMVNQIRSSYWNKLWQYSAITAMSYPIRGKVDN